MFQIDLTRFFFIFLTNARQCVFLYSSGESPSSRRRFRLPISIVVDRTPYLALVEPRSRLPFLAKERHVTKERPGCWAGPRHPRRVLQGTERHRQQSADRHALHNRMVSAERFI